MRKRWAHRDANFHPKPEQLQSCVNAVFKDFQSSLAVPFSLSIADPMQVDCPLICCSTEFISLSGYSEQQIIGHNCRFLIEPVPQDLINMDMKQLVRDYISAVRNEEMFTVAPTMREAWMPASIGLIRRVGTYWTGVDVRIDDGGLFCFQVNAKKNGSLFRNMFFLHQLDLFGHPYILGLQTQVPDPKVAENLWGLLPATPSLYRKHKAVAAEDAQCLRAACSSLLLHLAEVEASLIQMLLLTKPLSAGLMEKVPSREASLPMVWCSCTQPAQTRHRLDRDAPQSKRFNDAPIMTADVLVSQKLPIPEQVHEVELLAVSRMAQVVYSASDDGAPSAKLRACLEDVTTDWAAVNEIVGNITHPEYTVDKYVKHLVQAFPELVIQLFDWNSFDKSLPCKGLASTSGRTGEDEYQRTMGAFFAIYWLLRLDLDGINGFCFGVDSNWEARTLESAKEAGLSSMDKRVTFRDKMQWRYFKFLLADAGLIDNANGEVEVNRPRLAALLCLTAFHDMMKVDFLLPQVAYGEYHGFQRGETIQDHDVALAYIMDEYPELLPSFKSLSQEQKTAIQLMQCKVSFNHGWFVQAEAPPGAVFSSFRKVLTEASAGGVKMETKDIGLYFVHWLTDLAGAEGTPVAGCEKFAIKFPLPILMSFLRAFEFVEKLAVESERTVMESYLVYRWKEQLPPLGPPPEDASGIAKMRLLCMAQGNAAAILSAFEELGLADQEVLSVEMSRTGCKGQKYSDCYVQASIDEGGPAILVYYGPALLQDLQGDHPAARLTLLAEVYRKTRSLWPVDAESIGSSVTVRVDALKALSINEMRRNVANGGQWAIVRDNNNEATAHFLLTLPPPNSCGSPTAAVLRLPPQKW